MQAARELLDDVARLLGAPGGVALVEMVSTRQLRAARSRLHDAVDHVTTVLFDQPNSSLMTSVGDEAVAGRYEATLAAAKVAIQAARSRAVLAANSELIGLYWDLGRLILERQAADGWGTKVIQRFSSDLRGVPRDDGAVAHQPAVHAGLRRRWRPGSPTSGGRLPWGHNIELLDKLDTAAVREWYARNAIEHGWSRTVLANQIMSQLHQRAGAAPSNFADVLPAGDSELMQQLTKDPYNLEFLTSPPRSPSGTSSERWWRRSNGSCSSSEPGSPSSDASGDSSSTATSSSSTC